MLCVALPPTRRPGAPSLRGVSLARLTALVCALLLAVLALGAAAQDLVPVPKLEQRVTDLTGTLTPEQIASLDQRLAAFERTKGSQIAVLMVATTKPEAIEQYSIRVAEAWKIGRSKVDDGLILVVAKNDQRLRIEVGYGLEGVVPDAVARRVIRETIAPHFLSGDFYGGIVAGTDQLMRLVQGEALPPPRATPQQQRGGQGAEAFESYLVLLLVFTVIVGGMLTRILGRFVGATATGGIAGFLALAIAGTLIAALGAGVLAFFFSMLFGGTGGTIARGRRGGGWGGPVGGWGGGSWGGGGGGGWSGGGWSGGGGGFGGGGASGSWGD
jgi:uncharacterized protein